TWPGRPMEMASYSQSWARARIVSTSLAGVKSRPEGALRGSVWPVTRAFTLVPPMSMVRIDAGVAGGAGAVAGAARGAAGGGAGASATLASAGGAWGTASVVTTWTRGVSSAGAGGRVGAAFGVASLTVMAFLSPWATRESIEGMQLSRRVPCYSYPA